MVVAPLGRGGLMPLAHAMVATRYERPCCWPKNSAGGNMLGRVSVLRYHPARYPRPKTTSIYAVRQQSTHLQRHTSIWHVGRMNVRHG